jgi:hypothetical protein
MMAQILKHSTLKNHFEITLGQLHVANRCLVCSLTTIIHNSFLFFLAGQYFEDHSERSPTASTTGKS